MPHTYSSQRPHDSANHTESLLSRKASQFITQWHVKSPLVKANARNALPHPVSHIFLPTRATFFSDDHGEGDDRSVTQLWSSRAHRKHRYVYTSSHNMTRQGANMWSKIAHMGKFEYWNISWWVAQAFTWGSVVWVINGFAAFLPFCNSNFDTAPHSTGWTAFIGATIFEIGSVFGVWEVWNAEWMAFEEKEKEPEPLVNSDAYLECGERANKRSSHWSHTLRDGPQARQKWVWFSTNPKYWRQLGWYAAFFQLLAASIFWISGFTAIPAIQEAIKPHTGLLDGIYWVPQVIGGTGFVISSCFIMLESQHTWWKPRPQSLGWHVGFWNFLGGVGFTLSGIFGFYTTHWGMYQSALSTFWGGWAFLIGSIIQWYESVNTK